jgi:hypothetical protein
MPFLAVKAANSADVYCLGSTGRCNTSLVERP